jgi:hypothetical protein
MNPDATHPQYDAMVDTWRLCRDTTIGERAVKAKSDLYLPLLGGQTIASDKNYQAYKMRAQFFNANARTIDAMAGNIFRKQPTISLPTALGSYQGDIDMGGTSLEGFLNKVVGEVLEVTRYGILVEHPPQNQEGVTTVERASALGLRPYLTGYKAEKILNWRHGRVNNATVLTNVYLSETYEDTDGEEQIQVRELVLEGVYIQRIWRQSKSRNKTTWAIHDEITPTMQGQTITEIPFYFVGAKELGADVQNPVLEGLSNTCIGYYLNSADYENALHVAGTPTPWVNGITNPEDVPELHLGSNTFLKLPPDAQAGFLQCGSDVVAALKEAMQDKQMLMASQGAKMLEGDKRMAETAEAHAIKRGGENSILANIAGSVEMSMQKALQFMALWVGANPDDVTIELNKDYLPNSVTPQMLKEYRENYLTGTWSFETFFESCVAGEIISEGITYEDELERKENDVPALGMIGDDGAE